MKKRKGSILHQIPNLSTPLRERASKTLIGNLPVWYERYERCKSAFESERVKLQDTNNIYVGWVSADGYSQKLAYLMITV